MATIFRSPLFYQAPPNFSLAVVAQPLGTNPNILSPIQQVPYFVWGLLPLPRDANLYGRTLGGVNLNLQNPISGLLSAARGAGAFAGSSTVVQTNAGFLRAPLYAFRSWHPDPTNVAVRSQPLGTPKELSVENATQIPSYEYFNPIVAINFNAYGIFRFGASPTLFPPSVFLSVMAGAGNATFRSRQLEAALGSFIGNGALSATATNIHTSTKLGAATFAGSGSIGTVFSPTKLQARDPIITRIWPKDPEGVAIRSQPLGAPVFLNIAYATVIPRYEYFNPLYPTYPDSSITLTDTALLYTPQVTPTTLRGTGHFSATILPWQGSATFAGSGNISPLGTLRLPATATFAGSGQFASTAIPTQLGFASFTGNGAFSANPYVAQFGQVAFTGAGNLTGNPYTTLFGQATLTGSGALAYNPYVAQFGFATFAGSGTFAALSTPQIIVVNSSGVLFGGTGRFDIFGSSTVTWQGNSAFIGNGVFTSPPAIIYESVSAIFAGSGTYTINTTLTNTSTAVFAGSGAFTPDVAAYQLLTATASPFTGAGNFAPDEAAYLLDTASATLAGSGAFTPDESVTPLLAASASFTGSGAVSAFVEQLDAGNAILAGEGILNASPEQIAATSGVMSGSGSFTSNANFISANNPTTLAGRGLFAAYVNQLLSNATASLHGTGHFRADGERVAPKAKVLVSPGRVRLLRSPGRKHPNTT